MDLLLFVRVSCSYAQLGSDAVYVIISPLTVRLDVEEVCVRIRFSNPCDPRVLTRPGFLKSSKSRKFALQKLAQV